MKQRHFLAALALVSATVAYAADISVAGPYIRLVPPTAQTTAAFMVLKNGSDKERKLVKADSPAARAVELHTVIRDGEVMKMRPVAEVPIKARGETQLKPGSYHIMLINLTKPLKEGDEVALTLTFDDGS